MASASPSRRRPGSPRHAYKFTAHSHGRARLSPSLIPCSRFHQSEVALLLCTSAHSRCAITTLLLAAILVPALPFLPVAAVLPLPSLTGVLAPSARVRYPRRRRLARRWRRASLVPSLDVQSTCWNPSSEYSTRGAVQPSPFLLVAIRLT
jgi:hypothetical protein